MISNYLSYLFAGSSSPFQKSIALNNSFSSLNSFGSQILNDPDVWPSVEDPDIWPSPVPAGHKYVHCQTLSIGKYPAIEGCFSISSESSNFQKFTYGYQILPKFPRIFPQFSREFPSATGYH